MEDDVTSDYLKISVVTPTYNSACYLEETILSIINQNYPNLEYIIIDGGSTDGTVDIIKKYERFLAYWVSEKDKGMYDAIQKGFEKATGDILAWINSDDKYHSGALKCVNHIFKDIPDVQWITGIPSLFNSEGYIASIKKLEKWSVQCFTSGNYKWIQQENTFWRRSLWIKAGSKINNGFKYAGDFELWCRFFQLAQLHSVHTSFAGFRLHGNQLSVNFSSSYNDEAGEILKKYNRQLKKNSFLVFLWKLIIRSERYHSFLMKSINYSLTMLYHKLIKYPATIWYDFNINKWVTH